MQLLVETNINALCLKINDWNSNQGSTCVITLHKWQTLTLLAMASNGSVSRAKWVETSLRTPLHVHKFKLGMYFLAIPRTYRVWSFFLGLASSQLHSVLALSIV